MTIEEAKELLNNELLNTCSQNKAVAIDIVLRELASKNTEINKLNNVIDKLVKRIKYDTEWFYSDLDNKSEEEIKEYFMKE